MPDKYLYSFNRKFNQHKKTDSKKYWSLFAIKTLRVMR